jgi:hypothetical protein
VNQILLNNNGYFGGCKVNYNQHTADLLGLGFDSAKDRPVRYPTIAEVKIKNGQHFVVVLDDQYIVDPWIGAVGKNPYVIKSYRNFNIKEGETMFPNETLYKCPTGWIVWGVPNVPILKKTFPNYTLGNLLGSSKPVIYVKDGKRFFYISKDATYNTIFKGCIEKPFPEDPAANEWKQKYNDLVNQIKSLKY